MLKKIFVACFISFGVFFALQFFIKIIFAFNFLKALVLVWVCLFLMGSEERLYKLLPSLVSFITVVALRYLPSGLEQSCWLNFQVISSTNRINHLFLWGWGVRGILFVSLYSFAFFFLNSKLFTIIIQS